MALGHDPSQSASHDAARAHDTALPQASPVAQPVQGLRCVIGAFDTQVYRVHVEPVFVACTQAHDPEPLLEMAERLLDAADSTPVTRPFEGLADAAEALLLCADDAEDLGVPTCRLGESAVGERFLKLRERFVLQLLQQSLAVGALLDRRAVPLASPRDFACSHAAASFWMTVLSEGARCVDARTLLAEASRARLRTRSPLANLLDAAWDEWPPFEPDRLLVLGGMPDRRFESEGDFDWTLRSASSTASLARILHGSLRRFLHLEFLREAQPALFADLASLDELGGELLADYEHVIAACPWSERFESVWRFVAGLDAGLPEPVPVAACLRSAAQPCALAREGFTVYRDLYGLLAGAAREELGLYLLLR